MALINVLLLSQIAGYVIGLILSLCIIVPMSMHQDEFNGHCLLFSKGTWQEEDGQLLVAWGSRAYCSYVIAVGVLMFIVCCVQIYSYAANSLGCWLVVSGIFWQQLEVLPPQGSYVKLSMFMYRGTDSSFLSAFLEAVACAVLCALAVSAASLVTLGFITWCQNIVERFPSCEDATGQDIDKKDKISTHGFYIELGTAQFGAWGAFATWVGLAVFSTLKLCRYHQLQNIQVSMYRERQRLVNEGSTPPLTPVLARE